MTIQRISNSLSILNLRILAAALVVSMAVLPGSAIKAAESEIDLTYVWTAKPGMNEQLVATYAAVGEMLEAGEPGLLKYEISISEKGDQIVIHEVFENNAALAFHLKGTAAKFFPQISEIASPGPFIFRGTVAEELKAAAYQMNMGAIFTSEWNGFARDQ